MTDNVIDLKTTPEFAIDMEPISVKEDVSDPLFSDDQLVRIEAKLDMLIDLMQQIGAASSQAMEQLSDSPLGRMLGKFLGAD